MEDEKSIKLPVQANGNLREFKSPDSLRQFVEQEREAWEFIAVGTTKIATIKQISNLLTTPIFNALSKIVDSWEEDSTPSIEFFEEIQKQFQFPFSKTTKGKAVLSLQEDDATKAIVLSLMCMPRYDTTNEVAKRFISLWLKDARSGTTPLERGVPSMSVIIIRAQSILVSMSLGTKNIEQEKLLDNIDKAYQKINEEEAKLEAKMKEVASNAEKEYFTTRDKLSNFLNRRLKAYKRRHDSAQAQVRAAKNTYENEVELHASVEYWKDKKGLHTTAIGTWGKYLAASLGGTLTAFALVLSLPLIGTWISIGVETSESNQLLWGVVNPVVLSLGVVVLSIGSYVIKLTSQQFRTHQHLALEAEERYTMLKTYLALMNENKLKDAEDRKAALDVLFRPASTGIIQEQGNVMPSDSIVKIIGGKN